MLFFSHKCGQLGNRLFAFAHFISFAHHHNVTVANLAFEEYANYFETTNNDLFCRYPPTSSAIKSNLIRKIAFMVNRVILKLLRILRFYRSFVHSIVIADLPEFRFETPRYFELETDDFIKIAQKTPVILMFGRFFRNYEYFFQYQEVIRSYFRPLPSIQQSIKTLFSTIRIQNRTIVGVHIRRGDYREFKGGKYFFEQNEYLKKMQELQLSSPRHSFFFLLCSNEEIDRMVFQGLPHVLGLGSLVEDMYALAACDFIMGPPSTFSKWASFYGNVPLLQLEDLAVPVSISQFVILPPHKLYDF